MEYRDEHPRRPLSIAELAEQAKQFDWNPDIGFKFWARAADTIYQEVRMSNILDHEYPLTTMCVPGRYLPTRG